ncbi:hypothetical protein HDV02_002882 [Globomyces sp. JEL0801]|nr:hypothetical protein HDV02_002882 [Globomyces sp. JEL0801]
MGVIALLFIPLIVVPYFLEQESVQIRERQEEFQRLGIVMLESDDILPIYQRIQQPNNNIYFPAGWAPNDPINVKEILPGSPPVFEDVLNPPPVYTS